MSNTDLETKLITNKDLETKLTTNKDLETKLITNKDLETKLITNKDLETKLTTNKDLGINFTSKRCRYCYELIKLDTIKTSKNFARNPAYKLHIKKHKCKCSSCKHHRERKYVKYYKNKCAICNTKIILDDSTAVTWFEIDNCPRKPYTSILNGHVYALNDKSYKNGHLCKKDKIIINSLALNTNNGPDQRSTALLGPDQRSTNKNDNIILDLLRDNKITSYFTSIPPNLKISNNYEEIDKRLLISGDVIEYVLKIILFPRFRSAFIYRLTNKFPGCKLQYDECEFDPSKLLIAMPEVVDPTRLAAPEHRSGFNGVLEHRSGFNVTKDIAMAEVIDPTRLAAPEHRSGMLELFRSPLLVYNPTRKLSVVSSSCRYMCPSSLEKVICGLTSNHSLYLTRLCDTISVKGSEYMPLVLCEIILSYYDIVPEIINYLKGLELCKSAS